MKLRFVAFSVLFILFSGCVSETSVIEKEFLSFVQMDQNIKASVFSEGEAVRYVMRRKGDELVCEREVTRKIKQEKIYIVNACLVHHAVNRLDIQIINEYEIDEKEIPYLNKWKKIRIGDQLYLYYREVQISRPAQKPKLPVQSTSRKEAP